LPVPIRDLSLCAPHRVASLDRDRIVAVERQGSFGELGVKEPRVSPHDGAEKPFRQCRYLPHLPELPDALVEVPVFRPDQARVETTDLEELGSPVAPGRLQPPDVIVEGALEAPDPGQ